MKLPASAQYVPPWKHWSSESSQYAANATLLAVTSKSTVQDTISNDLTQRNGRTLSTD
jgi:hypothetical protein